MVGMTEPFFAPEFFVNGCAIDHVDSTLRRYVFFARERAINGRNERITRVVRCKLVIPVRDALQAWEECGADFGRVALPTAAQMRIPILM
jgi:hypothetical protein